jgi:hypothetical protein
MLGWTYTGYCAIGDLNNEGSWKDISDEVAKEIAEIWKSKYGEDWRNQLISKVGNRRRVFARQGH